MLITNKYNYPETLVKAVSYDGHRTTGDISCTQLIDAPQIRYLRKKHHLELTRDVSEMIWSLFGTCVHGVLERANISNKRRDAFLEVITCLKEVYSRGLSGSLNENETQQDANDAEKVFKWLLKFMFKFFPELESRYLY